MWFRVVEAWFAARSLRQILWMSATCGALAVFFIAGGWYRPGLVCALPLLALLPRLSSELTRSEAEQAAESAAEAARAVKQTVGGLKFDGSTAQHIRTRCMGDGRYEVLMRSGPVPIFYVLTVARSPGRRGAVIVTTVAALSDAEVREALASDPALLVSAFAASDQLQQQ